ncbi:hypothetical protein PV04_01388 [Phialophora macrospora]|uniref:Uncharacterized protein n=1 Tax=Phialophora macrospora TaxID=1851006 RepID=A0A0D2G343_9EURO|nr:hypothetical protein PV04_01388 [Phialophora macrospora]
MLARGTKSAYVCLRCQRNLRGDNLQSPARVLRRWQSAAPSRAALDEFDYGDDNNSTPVDQSQDESLSQPRPRGKRQFWRKWKPDPTAQLGVNSLGKPAEVILLPSRDRKITQVPKGDRTERVGTTLQESLDSENVPLSGATLAENIEQIRLSVGKLRGQLEKHEWKTLKRNLKTGFQTSQLKKYIRLRKGEHGPPPALRRNHSKDDIIRYLAEEVWGFITPMRDETSTPPDKTGKKVKFSFNLHEQSKLEHLLTHPTQPLKRIAEEHDVQIDVYPSQSRIRTTGPKHDANQALQKLVRYTKDLALVAVPLQGPLGLLYRDRAGEDYVNAYLKSLRRKYPALTIARDNENITLIHLNNPRAADQARREILLSAPMQDDLPQSTVWPDVDELTTSLQPVSAPPELPVMLHQYQWRRLVSSGVTLQTPDRTNGNSSFGRILRSLRDAFNPTAIGKAGSRQEPYYDLTAKFGQALVQEIPSPVDFENKVSTADEEDLEAENGGAKAEVLDKQSSGGDGARGSDPSDFEIKRATQPTTESSTETPSQAEEAPSSSTTTPPYAHARRLFVGGAPFLVQRLARMDPWPKQSSRDIDASARATLRLELSPISTPGSKSSPRFEIFVTAGEETDGKRSRLNIARISAIHQEDQFTVSCPQNDVDIAFTRQVKQDLVYPGSVDTDVIQSLMNAFRSYIGHAQSTGSSDWVFLPFVTLPLHHALRNTHELVQHAAARKKKSGRAKKKTSAQADIKLEYLLSTVDVVDVDSRLFSARSAATPNTTTEKKQRTTQSPSRMAHFCLDHITYTGADNTRQELRLAQGPVLHPPPLMPPQPHLPSFVGAALSLARQLSSNPMKPGYPASHELDFDVKFGHDDVEVEGGKEVEAEDTRLNLKPKLNPNQDPNPNPRPKDKAKAKAQKPKVVKKGEQSKSKPKLKPKSKSKPKVSIKTKSTPKVAIKTEGSLRTSP